MSSILRALKKLDNEMPRSASIHDDSIRVDIRHTVRKRAWKDYMLRKVSLAASVFILLFLAVWMVWQQPDLLKGLNRDPRLSDRSASAPAQPKIPEAGAEKPLIHSTEKKLPKENFLTQKNISPDDSLQAEMAAQAPVSSTQGEIRGTKEKKTVLPRAVSPALNPVKEPDPILAENLTEEDLVLDIVEMPDVNVKVSPTAVIETKRSAETSEKNVPFKLEPVRLKPVRKEEKMLSVEPVNPPVKVAVSPAKNESAYQNLPERQENDTGLEIQALVWSPVPEERFTVVNGDILKMGGFIDDVSVQYIGENFIVLQKKGERWQQKMQVR